MSLVRCAVSCTVLALVLVIQAPWSCNAQPHPFPMGFTISAVSTCPPASRAGRNRAAASVAGEEHRDGGFVMEKSSVCHLRSFNVCMELQYYPTICRSRVLRTHVSGDCPQNGNYTNNTYVTLTPGDNSLPQDQWVVNFNSTNPMLPVLPHGGLTCQGIQCTVVVQTQSRDNLHGSVGMCTTNITVIAHGWYAEGGQQSAVMECSEEPALDRCQKT